MELHALFPEAVWTGVTGNRTSLTDDIDPGSEDYDRLAAELIAVQNFLFIRRVRVATTAALVFASEDGITFTNDDTQAALVTDSETLDPGDNILVKDQEDLSLNGLMTVIDPGTDATNWVIQRYDNMFVGMKVVTVDGSANINKIYTCVKVGELGEDVIFI